MSRSCSKGIQTLSTKRSWVYSKVTYKVGLPIRYPNITPGQATVQRMTSPKWVVQVPQPSSTRPLKTLAITLRKVKKVGVRLALPIDAKTSTKTKKGLNPCRWMWRNPVEGFIHDWKCERILARNAFEVPVLDRGQSRELRPRSGIISSDSESRVPQGPGWSKVQRPGPNRILKPNVQTSAADGAHRAPSLGPWDGSDGSVAADGADGAQEPY